MVKWYWTKPLLIKHYRYPILLCFWFWIAAAGAQLPLQGHLKLQASYADPSSDSLESAAGANWLTNYNLDFRLKKSYQWRAWQTEAHYQLEIRHGDNVALRNKLAQMLPDLTLDRDKTQWWSLSDTLKDNQQNHIVQRLARLVVGYSSEQLVLRIGRQALSWGHGQVFNPMDLFDPFAPDANDKDYKPGADMIYGQWLFEDGSDLQGVIVPRRDFRTETIESQQSSAALKWLSFWKTLQIDLMIARHYRDKVLGLGLSGAWHESVWRMNLVTTRLDQGRTRTTGIINFNHAWQWGEKNINGTVEYFHNGFGNRDNHYNLTELSPALTERLARGEVFNTGQDYLAAHLTVEWTPLLTLTPIFIINLNDGSRLFVGQGNYSLKQDVNLNLAINIGFGTKGTEFGGLPLTAGSDIYYRQANQVWVRLGYFF